MENYCEQLMTYIATSHQGAINIFWLYFWRALTASIMSKVGCDKSVTAVLEGLCSHPGIYNYSELTHVHNNTVRRGYGNK